MQTRFKAKALQEKVYIEYDKVKADSWDRRNMRVEIELKRNMVDYWNDCFNDLHILQPNWTLLKKVNEQAMVYMLIHEEGKWGELNKRTKYKYKKLIKEISPIDLTDLMKMTLKENEKQLQKQIDFWLSDFQF